MQIQQIQKTMMMQREFFNTGQTQDLNFRLKMLKRLKSSIIAYEEKLTGAIYADLKKSGFEFYVTEIAMVLEELTLHISHLKHWAKPIRIRNSFLQFKSRSYIYQEPFGQVLIVAPWNYPFQLLFLPLVGAISAGNTVVLKPSPENPETSKIMADLITNCFPPEYVAIFHGGIETNTILFHEKFDLMFFTGSPRLGKIVMTAAAQNLTPVILELGGKSPCIVHKDADLALAARRIIWGKYLNVGQTCTAPDYLMVHRKVKKELLKCMLVAIQEFWGADPKMSQDYSRVVNDTHMKRLAGLMEAGTIITGGNIDFEERYIAPTIIDDITFDDPIMQEEIFGPLLPVIEYDDLSEVIDFVNHRPKPLALYLFTTSRKIQNEVIHRVSSGGGTINDTLMHVTNNKLPFGGIGESGMGRYHGRYSFDAFSHQRSILMRSNIIDIPTRYPPYTANKLSLMRMILGHK